MKMEHIIIGAGLIYLLTRESNAAPGGGGGIPTPEQNTATPEIKPPEPSEISSPAVAQWVKDAGFEAPKTISDSTHGTVTIETGYIPYTVGSTAYIPTAGGTVLRSPDGGREATIKEVYRSGARLETYKVAGETLTRLIPAR